MTVSLIHSAPQDLSVVSPVVHGMSLEQPARKARGILNFAAHVPARMYLSAAAVGVSIVAASGFLVYSFGIDRVLTALAGASIEFLAFAVLFGAMVQVVRAQRASWLLSRDQKVTLRHSFQALVVGQGIGDLVPLIPGGPVLRSALTKRLSGIPMAFSAGVFMLEGMLDGLGPSLLLIYLFFAASLATGTRWLLGAALAQSALLLFVPLVPRALSHVPRWIALPTNRFARMRLLMQQLASGLEAVLTRGPRIAFSVLAFSLLVTAVEALQLVLFLQAFGITAGINQVVLILVLTLTANSIPIKVPGAGTVVATGVLALAGLHGPGLAGYVLTSRFVSSVETPLLAVTILAWWRRAIPAQPFRDRPLAWIKRGVSGSIEERKAA